MNQSGKRRSCYAASIGGCAGDLTAEHFLSKAFLKDMEEDATLTIRGFPFGNYQGNKRVSKKAMTVKSLCAAHNSQLSEVDANVLSAIVGTFPPVRLAFAWAQTDEVSVILGQVNFFLEFDVCFFRSRSVFEVRPKP